MKQGKITASRLNVRSQPSLRGKIIGSLSRNALIDITAEPSPWLEIAFQNTREAFVHGDFVELLPQELEPQKRGRVTASALNVRGEAASDGRLVGLLRRDAVVDIIGQEDGWLEIAFQDGTAFVFGRFVEVIQAEEPRKGVVSATSLNVRARPARDGQRIGALARGTTIEILDQIGDWLEIEFNGQRAFVHGDFVRDAQDTDLDKPLFERDDLLQVALVPEKTLKLPSSPQKEDRRVVQAWNNFGNLLQVLSEEMRFETASSVAVLSVESGGRGFVNGKMVIRFENHYFWRLWGKQHAETFSKHFKFNDDKVWTGHQWRESDSGSWQGFHGNQSKEWAVLEFARSLDDSAALQSISMGAPQIMGANHKKIGYATVQAMFENFNKDDRFQIFGLFDFFDTAMLMALRRKQFTTFAGGYNGKGQAATYGAWIQDHYDAFKQLMA